MQFHHRSDNYYCHSCHEVKPVDLCFDDEEQVYLYYCEDCQNEEGYDPLNFKYLGLSSLEIPEVLKLLKDALETSEYLKHPDQIWIKGILEKNKDLVGEVE